MDAMKFLKAVLGKETKCPICAGTCDDPFPKKKEEVPRKCLQCGGTGAMEVKGKGKRIFCHCDRCEGTCIDPLPKIILRKPCKCRRCGGTGKVTRLTKMPDKDQNLVDTAITYEELGTNGELITHYKHLYTIVNRQELTAINLETVLKNKARLQKWKKKEDPAMSKFIDRWLAEGRGN